MEDDFGASYITIEDDEGNEFELEYLDTMELDGVEYMVFLPADMDVDNPDYGYIILRVEQVDGEDQFVSVDSEEELERAYNHYMEIIFADGEESGNEGEADDE